MTISIEGENAKIPSWRAKHSVSQLPWYCDETLKNLVHSESKNQISSYALDTLQGL